MRRADQRLPEDLKLRRALAGLAGLGLVGAFVVTSHAALAAATFTLQPTCGSVGTSVQATGAGWTPGSNVTITFDPQGTPPSVVTVPGNAIGPNGNFSVVLTVPSRANRASAYQVQATQRPPSAAGVVVTVTAAFYIPCPGLSLNPTCGSPGDAIAVHGQGFRLDDQVQITFTPPAGGRPIATPIPQGDSTFDVSIAVPQDPPGTYAVLGIQTRTQVAARAEFKIPCSKASIKLIPNVGPPGTVTVVTGMGFPVGAVVRLTWSQGIPLVAPSITIDSSQGFQMTLLIYPHDALGQRQLRAGPDLTVTSAPIFNIATAEFLVVPGTEQPRDFTWRH